MSLLDLFEENWKQSYTVDECIRIALAQPERYERAKRAEVQPPAQIHKQVQKRPKVARAASVVPTLPAEPKEETTLVAARLRVARGELLRIKSQIQRDVDVAYTSLVNAAPVLIKHSQNLDEIQSLAYRLSRDLERKDDKVRAAEARVINVTALERIINSSSHDQNMPGQKKSLLHSLRALSHLYGELSTDGSDDYAAHAITYAGKEISLLEGLGFDVLAGPEKDTQLFRAHRRRAHLHGKSGRKKKQIADYKKAIHYLEELDRRRRTPQNTVRIGGLCAEIFDVGSARDKKKYALLAIQAYRAAFRDPEHIKRDEILTKYEKVVHYIAYSVRGRDNRTYQELHDRIERTMTQRGLSKSR